MDILTSTQISEWQEYDRLDPIGESREDVRSAYLCSLITNIAIKMSGSGSKLTNVDDFLLKWDIEEIQKKEDDLNNALLQAFKSIAKSHEKKEE